MSRVTIYPAEGPLRGTVRPPGDKSVSHRAAILGALAEGASRITGFSPSEDCARTVEALAQMGVQIRRHEDVLVVRGPGPAWGEPARVLDLGNSGTTMRLLAGVLAGMPGFRVLDGDDSLRRRPMGRVVHPLREMGACLDGRQDGNLAPLAVRGARLVGKEFTLAVASAQVKSCLLLAGLLAEGETWVQEPLPTRDHTERLLPLAGIGVATRGGAVGVRGPARPRPFELQVPGDPSAAAFWVVAASVVPGSEVVLRGVGLNPGRAGFLRVLSRMGASVRVTPGAGTGPEPVGDLEVRGSALRGTEIEPHEIPGLIDELPVLAVAACAARGITRVCGAGELRVKESDRIAGVVRGLSALGARIAETPDGWVIEGPSPLHGGRVSSLGDHRLAMAWAVAALGASGPVELEGAEAVAVSYPDFFGHLVTLGGRVSGGGDGDDGSAGVRPVQGG